MAKRKRKNIGKLIGGLGKIAGALADGFAGAEDKAREAPQQAPKPKKKGCGGCTTAK